MSFTCTIQTAVNTNGARPVAGSQSETGSTITEIDQNYAAGTIRSVLALVFASSALQLVELMASQPLTIEVNGTDEVQQLAMTGSPTGGTFTMTFDGQTTAGIAYNATAAIIQAALESLSNIAAGDVACTGGPLPGSAVSIAFRSNLGLQDVATITTTDSLSGGTTPATAITTPTPGVAPTETIQLAAGMPLAWGVSASYFASPLPTDVAKVSISCATASRLQGKVLTN